MNPLEFRLVDAFASSPYTGNVAGVVFDADTLTDHQMQLIAREFAAPETTFVLQPSAKDAAVRIRWFSPACEVSFCGHATLGAIHALIEAAKVNSDFVDRGSALPVECKAGILQIRCDSPQNQSIPRTIWLDMPHSEPKSRNVPVPAILHHLGISPNDVDPRIPAIRTHDDDVILAVKSINTLFGLTPAMNDLARYCRSESLRGVLVTTTNVLTPVTAVQSRFFAPAAGIDEDPVTGSIHGPLGLHLVECDIVPMVDGVASFHCAQARAGGRAGLVRVVVTDAEEKKRVRIGGSCITTASGVFQSLPPRD